jgi:hypothetical protein
MRVSKVLCCTSIALAICYYGHTQTKVINSKGEYVHEKTKVHFPVKIENYTRSTIISYNNSKDNISVSYTDQLSYGRTVYTIFIYPAGRASEGRLRKEYLNSLQAITYVNKAGITIRQYPITFEKDKYKVNGYKAVIDDKNGRSNLSVFECGKWFLKIRITNQNQDSLEIEKLEKRVTDIFCPTDIVRRYPLKLIATINYGDLAFADSLILGSSMGSAFSKIEWVNENVDSLERISGFPDLYLESHIESLKAFVLFEKEHPGFFRQKSTDDYLTQLNLLIDQGYVDEFIMEQFSMIMIVPKNHIFDFPNYYKWKLNNPIKINLNNKFYLIEYK